MLDILSKLPLVPVLFVKFTGNGPANCPILHSYNVSVVTRVGVGSYVITPIAQFDVPIRHVGISNCAVGGDMITFSRYVNNFPNIKVDTEDNGAADVLTAVNADLVYFVMFSVDTNFNA